MHSYLCPPKLDLRAFLVTQGVPPKAVRRLLLLRTVANKIALYCTVRYVLPRQENQGTPVRIHDSISAAPRKAPLFDVVLEGRGPGTRLSCGETRNQKQAFAPAHQLASRGGTSLIWLQRLSKNKEVVLWQQYMQQRRQDAFYQRNSLRVGFSCLEQGAEIDQISF
jgi:hypothetical protein